MKVNEKIKTESGSTSNKELRSNSSARYEKGWRHKRAVTVKWRQVYVSPNNLSNRRHTMPDSDIFLGRGEILSSIYLVVSNKLSKWFINKYGKKKISPQMIASSILLLLLLLLLPRLFFIFYFLNLLPLCVNNILNFTQLYLIV